MAGRQEWEQATAGSRLLAIAADAELRRRYPGQRLDPCAPLNQLTQATSSASICIRPPTENPPRLRRGSATQLCSITYPAPGATSARS
jgi:L-rhamnose isomerase